MKKLIFIIIGLSLFMTSCSKEGGKTGAKLKLSLGGIVNLTSGIGSGGAILFARSASGEQFGKIVTGSEENLVMANGDWTFYALMWEGSDPERKMNGNVRCAKSFAKLGGTDVTLNLNLTNANCSDAEFSNGKYYNEATTGLIHFPDIFIDECDDPNTPSWFCGADNQGSAVTYRLKFQSYTKTPNGQIVFGSDFIPGPCKKIIRSSTDVFEKGLEVNFPTGNGQGPFIVSVEMFLGSLVCDPAEGKGSHTVVLFKGLGQPANPISKIVESTSTCTNIYPQVQTTCDDILGTPNVGTCSNTPASYSKFVPNVAANCSASTPSPVAIKHLLTIPLERLCDPFEGKSNGVGSNLFAGGHGTVARPFKICNEWQLNQIGDSTVSGMANKSYKLMKNLDMNKTDFGPYAKPACIGVANSLIEGHHNLNPLDKISDNCTTVKTNHMFTGQFIGNNKTISNARISAETVEDLGFVRKLSGGVIRNLNFKNLEVRGKGNIGGVAGFVDNFAKISNIRITGLDVEGKSYNSSGTTYGADNVAGVAGVLLSLSTIENVTATDAEVRGRDHVGGLVGYSESGKLIKTGFSGKIEHYDSSGDKVGGLVGYGVIGTSIESSFSEGIINSNSLYTGGIIGEAYNSPITSISSVYSTMVINNRNNGSSGSIFIGGISGNMGSMSDVYFDGTINYTGGASANKAGISTNLDSSSSCFSTYSPAGASCDYIPVPLFRNGTNPSFTSNIGWVKTPGSIPRFVWEQRECALPDNQLTLIQQAASPYYRGTVLNPMIICNSTQLKDMDGRAVTLNYRLADDINLSHWTTQSNLIGTFNGHLNGDEHILYGANVIDSDVTVPEYVGLIRVNGGIIRGLKLVNNKIYSMPSELGTGLLVGNNDGTLFNIELSSNTVNGSEYVGGLVGYNSTTGKIDLVDTQEDIVTGQKFFGGLVGFNMGGASISRVSIRSQLTHAPNPSDDYEKVGGIVGINDGSIDQARFSGQFFSITPSSVAGGIVSIGGIAGTNNGSISNTYTDSEARLNVKNTAYIGGLIGHNNGTLTDSFNLGKIINDAGGAVPPGEDFHPIIGKNDMLPLSDYVFWLENSIASRLGQSSTTTFTSGTPNIINILSANTIADLFMPTHGQDKMKLMIPMTYSTGYDFTYTGEVYPTNTDITYYISYPHSDFGDTNRTLTTEELINYGTFCGQISGPVGYEKCDVGFDMVFNYPEHPETNIGYNRLIDFYKATMEGNSIPANTPIWELEPGEDHPRLVQLKHH